MLVKSENPPSFQPLVLLVPRKRSVSVRFRRGKTHPSMNRRSLEPMGHERYCTILSRFSCDKEPSGHTLRCVIKNKWKCVFELCTVVSILFRCNKGLVQKLADKTKGVRRLLFSPKHERVIWKMVMIITLECLCLGLCLSLSVSVCL